MKRCILKFHRDGLTDEYATYADTYLKESAMPKSTSHRRWVAIFHRNTHIIALTYIALYRDIALTFSAIKMTDSVVVIYNFCYFYFSLNST